MADSSTKCNKDQPVEVAEDVWHHRRFNRQVEVAHRDTQARGRTASLHDNNQYSRPTFNFGTNVNELGL